MALTPDRLPAVMEAMHRGWTPAQVEAVTKMDPWFLDQVYAIVDKEK